LDLDQLGSPDTASKPLKVGQIIELERRVGAGLPISDEEQRQLMAAREAIQKAFEGARESFARVAEQLRPVFAKLPDALARFAQWQKDMSALLAPFIAQMVAAYREMPPRIQVALLELGKHGWYLDGDLGLTELWALEKSLTAGDADEVDAYLTAHFEGRLADIEEELVKALPTRAEILRAAFAAHRREEFVLSVPTLLTQSDGVCLDLTGFYLFIKDRQLRAPQVARHVTDAALDAFSAALLSPLTQVLPINASGQERNRMVQDQGLPTWRELNRHLVLHGESVDYGTRVNSLKAIALINYLVGFVRQKQAGATQSVGLANVALVRPSSSP
jgi:hypothetical protein